jgi:hypothetical protein
MNKVVYTCITGAYDTLKEPKIVSEGWDYICFTDSDLKSETWQIIKIGKSNDQIRHQRKKKIYNEYIFENYDVSVWVDGSMFINCNLDELLIENDSDFSIMKHPAQTCITGEARGILILKKDTKESLERQINDYFSEGYPKDYGIIASGIMIRRHTDKVINFCKLWYEQVKKYSHRDQMSFGYVHWKNRIDVNLMSFNLIRTKFLIKNHVKTKLF